MRREVSPELVRLMKSLRLGRLLPVLPERLRQARASGQDPERFLETLLTDEVQRRARQRYARRARKAGLSPKLVIDAWDPASAVSYDRALLDELLTLRFVEQGHHVLIMGPVGVGKTMLGHALGHLAVQQERSVVCATAEDLFHQLKAARLDDSHEEEMRRLTQVDLLVIDDLALRPMDSTETADLYELVVARHRQRSMVVTTNRDPAEWLDVLADPLHAQALVDRFVNNAYDLVIEGQSYRRRQKPTFTPG
jgi:DNA replication protein DnaC